MTTKFMLKCGRNLIVPNLMDKTMEKLNSSYQLIEAMMILLKATNESETEMLSLIKDMNESLIVDLETVEDFLGIMIRKGDVVND